MSVKEKVRVVPTGSELAEIAIFIDVVIILPEVLNIIGVVKGNRAIGAKLTLVSSTLHVTLPVALLNALREPINCSRCPAFITPPEVTRLGAVRLTIGDKEDRMETVTETCEERDL